MFFFCTKVNFKKQIRSGVSNLFYKGSKTIFLGFRDHVFFIAALLLTSGSIKASIDSRQTSGHGRLAGQIHLQKLTCGQFDLRAALC